MNTPIDGVEKDFSQALHRVTFVASRAGRSVTRRTGQSFLGSSVSHHAVDISPQQREDPSQTAAAQFLLDCTGQTRNTFGGSPGKCRRHTIILRAILIGMLF